MIDKIVEYANKNKKISDFHLRSGCDFSYREIGEIIVDKSIKITEKNLEELLNKHCTPQDVETFKKNNELDCAFKLKDIRFRANFYRSLKGISAVFVENISDDRLLSQIARETGAKIGGTLYPGALSGPNGPAPTYLKMMRHNAKMISQALAPERANRSNIT